MCVEEKQGRKAVKMMLLVSYLIAVWPPYIYIASMFTAESMHTF